MLKNNSQGLYKSWQFDFIAGLLFKIVLFVNGLLYGYEIKKYAVKIQNK